MRYPLQTEAHPLLTSNLNQTYLTTERMVPIINNTMGPRELIAEFMESSQAYSEVSTDQIST